jgi:hypothetical protein
MHQESSTRPTSDVYCLAKDDTAYQWLIPIRRSQALVSTPRD